MSALVVIIYPNMELAEDVLATLRKLQTEHLEDFDDAAFVVKDLDGGIKLHQGVRLTQAGALEGTMWGVLAGLLFFEHVSVPVGMSKRLPPGNDGETEAPHAGIVSLSDLGIDDTFAEELHRRMPPGSSAIFALLRNTAPETVIPELAQFGGTALQTSLSPGGEKKLRAAD
jgi:uncharacterized membrane protein